MGETNVIFCGDREVGARIVGLIRDQGARIVGLGLNSPPWDSHAQQVAEAADVDMARVFSGRSFCSEVALERFAAARPDLGVCCGFASILTRAALAVPRWGWVNVHRSYLPYNRGLDPLQWALVDGTPAGVSLHVMTDRVDAGPVLAQAELALLPDDDSASMAERADRLAFRLFEQAWPRLSRGDLTGVAQDESLATYHSRADCDALRGLDLDASMKVGRLLDILRGYSGAGKSGVYFDLGADRYLVRTEVRRPAAGPRAATSPGNGATARLEHA